MRKICKVVALLGVVLLALPCIATARTFICNSNPDYISKRCTVHPYTITRVVDGRIEKGHLVGCQFKSYSCLGNKCQDNYGTAVIPFDFPMTDLNSFCSLLCTTPACTEPWQ